MAKQRWSVFFPELGTFIQHPSGNGVGWTPNRKEAEEMATYWGSPGEVVDADDFAYNWPMYCMFAILGGIMPRALAKKKFPGLLDLV